MNEQPDPHELAGEYVLGTLPAEGRREVELALAGDGALRAAVAWWEACLLPLTDLAAPVTPSPSLWARIERSITAPQVAPGKAAGRTPWWDRLNIWRALAASGFAAAAIMAAVVGVRMQTTEQARYLVVLAAPKSMAPGWVLQLHDDRTLTLEPLAGATIPDGRVLQLWTKADAWQGPVSLGLVTPGQANRVRLDKLPRVEPNQLFEITLEPAGGSPIGRPTGPILYIGRAVKMT